MLRIQYIVCFCVTVFSFIYPSTPLLANNSDTLDIAVYKSPPFGMKRKSDKIDGLMIQIWEDIAKDMGVHYRYTLTDMPTLISGLQEKKFDVGLGAISITPKREKLIDFTHAVNPSGTGIAVSKNFNKVSFFEKWSPLFVNFLELLFSLLLMLLVSAIIVYFIEKRNVKEASEKNIRNIGDGLWWSAVTMTTVGYGDKVPTSTAGKVLGILWIFISIIFFSLFTANASAKLIHSSKQQSNTINSVEDLYGINVVAVAKSSGAEYLNREHVTYKSYPNIKEAIQAVISGEADAIVSNVPVLKYHNKTNFKNELAISDHLLVRNNMGIALQENSPLKEQINLLLLEKIAEPKWQHAVYKYIGSKED